MVRLFRKLSGKGTRRYPIRLIKYIEKGITSRKTGEQTNGLEGHFPGLSLADEVFGMHHPPMIPVIVKGLLPFFSEIIGKMVNRDTRNF